MDARLNLPPELTHRLAELGRSRARPIALRDNTWFADAVVFFVVGASYLLGGAPGSRKSGLATQLALDLARQGKRVLIVPTEEPADRVWERLVKMMDGFDAVGVNTAMTNLAVERNPPSVEQLPNYVSSQVLSPSDSSLAARIPFSPMFVSLSSLTVASGTVVRRAVVHSREQTHAIGARRSAETSPAQSKWRSK